MGEDIVAKYSGQLIDLKMNSKPLINLLTMMAEDYIRHAPVIVQVIEKHLQIVKPELKLPILYLIDSIIKNVKKEYIQLFTQNIVSTFCGVFEKVDEKTRGLLWKLRGTWSGHFPYKKLYAIDLRCHEIDQKWPIQAPPPATGSIHVNPLFLTSKAQALLKPEQMLSQTREVPATVVTTAPMDTSATEVQMRAQLLAKQKELLELQTKKVELELLQTKLQIEEKARRQMEEENVMTNAVKQERMLMGMAETAKNRTEQIQQQLSHLNPKASSGPSVKPSSSSKNHDSSSDRESHSSSSSKLAKSHSSASGSSVEGSSPKKSKSSRDRDNKNDREINSSSSSTRQTKGHTEASVDGSPSKKSKSSRDKSDRDSHSSSSSSKQAKHHGVGETSGSSVDGSPSKKSKSSRDKDKSDKSRDRHESKDKDKESRHRHRDKDKDRLVDPRLKRRMEREKGAKVATDEKNREQDNLDMPCKPSEWKDYRVRQQAVLRKSYRKHTGCDVEDDESVTIDPMIKIGSIKSENIPGDVDLRYEASVDVDLRTETDGSGPEPPAKKSRPGSHGAFDDLFGHQDVDLRAGSSCWTQVKLKTEVDDALNSQPGQVIIETDMGRDSKILRSPGPPSPTNSVVSSTSSACDPLGRPLIYNRLPNDPEERKRSLDSRSTSIDAVEQFKSRHIDHALRGNGILSEEDMRAICLKAKEEHDEGVLNADQYVGVMKQIVQISNTSAMKEVQQMQMTGNSWQMSNNAPNPWVTASENNIWSSFPSSTSTGMGVDFPVRFPGSNTPWEAPKPTPWMAPAIPPAPTGPNPFEEAIARPIMVDDLIPKANPKELRLAEQDVGRTIPIDKVYRQIRFYRESAIVMTGLNGDEPRDLQFQRDDRPRTILINNKPLEVYLGETKKFDLNRVSHTLKIGCPGRELCIDDKRHELFFGGHPKNIFVDGRKHSFQFLPPSPQVAVGEIPRYDLCAGKVTLTLDALTNLSVFLDEKLQKIEISGEPVVLRFGKGFNTVSLNGRTFPTNFGARLPFSITLPNSEKHYLRFNAVHPEIEHGIQTFINANYGGSGGGEWSDNRNNAHLGRGGRGGPVRGGNVRARCIIGRGRRDSPMDIRPAPSPWTQDMVQQSPPNPNPLDLLNNLFQTPSDAMPKNNNSVLDHSYESEQSMIEEDIKVPDIDKPAETGGNVNVSDLVANLIKCGLLPAVPVSTESSTPEEPAEEKDMVQVKEEDNSVPDEELKEVKEEVKPTVPPLPTVDVSFSDNLKERRDIVIGQISTGVQCSQCGLRFPPDQTLRYSQHLDWHFRQNRREKANARKALSRKWYYDLSDWIQFEEIEDLEERAASLFENQDGDGEHESKSPTALNPDDFTVLASSHEGAVCPQCGESFESFFDEEREEWRLRNAKLDEYEGEEKLYHPICHQDYLRSLVEESIVEEDQTVVNDDGDNKENEEKEVTPSTENEEDDEVLIIQEGKKEVVVMEIDIDDDDVEKNNSSVNLLVNEDKSNNIVNVGSKTDDVTDKENYIAEKDCVNTCSDNSSLDNNTTRSSLVQSPILIDEDSTFLPGLCDETEGGVFGFALGSGSQKENTSEHSKVEEKRIIYEPMKFDMPPIKLEPPDEEPIEEDVDMVPNDFMSNLQPFLASSANKSPGGSEPMNIDLTEEDSTDAVDSGARLVTQIRTSIDGNLQLEDATAIPFMPAAKIRINLSGFVPSSAEKEKVSSPQQTNHGSESESAESQEQVLVKDGGSSNNIVSNDSEINKDNPVDPVLTEEMKRLKPRLVGRKLTNYPPKFKGKEESGLCVIC